MMWKLSHETILSLLRPWNSVTSFHSDYIFVTLLCVRFCVWRLMVSRDIMQWSQNPWCWHLSGFNEQIIINITASNLDVESKNVEKCKNVSTLVEKRQNFDVRRRYFDGFFYSSKKCRNRVEESTSKFRLCPLGLPYARCEHPPLRYRMRCE